MAIHFRCKCGKQMQAKDEFAGRRYRCPQCAKVVQIPIPKAKQPAASSTPSARPAVKTAPPKAIAKPAAPPLARPLAAAPLARSVPSAPRTSVAAAPPRLLPWEDRSLVQTPTPWLSGDEARFQAGIKPMREGLRCWEQLLLTVLILGGAAGAIAAAKYLS